MSNTVKMFCIGVAGMLFRHLYRCNVTIWNCNNNNNVIEYTIYQIKNQVEIYNGKGTQHEYVIQLIVQLVLILIRN